MKLYEIQKELETALLLVDEDGCFTDEALAIIEKSELALNEKAENIGKMIQIFEQSESSIDAEIERLTKLKKSQKSNKEALKEYISFNLQKLGIDKLDTGIFKFSFRKSTSVEILDEGKIPDEFKKEKTIVSIDKKSLGEALKVGEVKGAKLIEKQNLQIK